MRDSVINPAVYPDWNQLLLESGRHSFFLTANWARVLWDAYHYDPAYFVSLHGGRVVSLAPLMEVKSFLTGRRAVSLPFTDECPLFFWNQAHFQKYFDLLAKRGKQAGWRYIEWRGGEPYFRGNPPFCRFYVHTLELSEDAKDMLSGFRSSTRRNIKKAGKTGLQIDISTSLESVRAFYRLNCMTRKGHGLPPQPFRFFRLIFEHIISRKMGIVVLAREGDRPVAGSVFFHFGRKAVYKYGASDRKFQHLRANNLVMWEAIRWYAARGFKSFSFGRTSPENKGLLQFKRGWGVTEETREYFRFDPGKGIFLAKATESKPGYDVFRKMPGPLLKLTGSILYRHVA